MSACGIYGDFYLYLEFYLPNRKQFTVLNGVKSNLADVKFGVPQGSLIGPQSFSVSVNDMEKCINCDSDQFADDSTVHTTSPSVDSVLTDLQKSAKSSELC